MEPVPGPEAFEQRTADARYSQAALMLSVSAAVAGRDEVVEEEPGFPLPSPTALRRTGGVSVREAAEVLDVDTDAYVEGTAGPLPGREARRMARRVFDDPAPEHAAALVEAGMQSDDRVVRTAAAVSALDTTGPREEVLAVLEESADSRDPTTRDMARIGLSRINPQHPKLARLVVRERPIRPRRTPSHTALMVHGTFAANQRWWRRGGDFHSYVGTLRPPLNLHDEDFRWSGAYSHAARDLAADQLEAWIAAEQLLRPDVFGHSHGVTVANLATAKGVELDRLVMLAWPVHRAWLPDLAHVRRVISVRVRLDLVVLADRGGQSLPAAFVASPKVEEHVDGWFKHELPHVPDHWRRHGLDAHLP